MKNINLNKLCLFLVAILTILTSCKKTNIEEGKVNDLLNKRTNDTLLAINTGVANVAGIQSVYKNHNNDFDYYLYGKRNAEGQITTLTGAAVKKYNSKDTVVNYLFDNDQRIKAYYLTLRGTNDKTYLTLIMLLILSL